MPRDLPLLFLGADIISLEQARGDYPRAMLGLPISVSGQLTKHAPPTANQRSWSSACGSAIQRVVRSCSRRTLQKRPLAQLGPRSTAGILIVLARHALFGSGPAGRREGLGVDRK